MTTLNDVAQRLTQPVRTRQILQKVLFVVESRVKSSPQMPVRTGTLRRSITTKLDSDTKGRVGTNLSYARAVHDGTKRHIIRPRRKKVLRFQIGSRVIFAKKVQHPGTRARPFLRDGWRRARADVRRIVANSGLSIIRGRRI